mmetsp:Transcript_29500/g.68484  ORF Transcript_29500/g.68484 Transcript_29500/m.68484 type:complete len:103 (+) Transcript_29500:677-985(+)
MQMRMQMRLPPLLLLPLHPHAAAPLTTAPSRFNFEVLVRFNLEIAIGFGATIALIYWKAASEGRDLFNPEGKDDAAPMVDLEDAFGASVEETSSNDSAPPGL